MEMVDPAGVRPTHTVPVSQYDGKYYVSEYSWQPYKGIKQMHSMSDVLKYYTEKMYKQYGKNPLRFWIMDDPVPPGATVDEYMAKAKQSPISVASELRKLRLYKAILEAYKHIPIEINPNHTSSGTAYLRGTPRVVLRDKDPMVLAHELGHIDNDRKATQKLIDLMGWTANTTGWEWLMGKATVAKESLANRTALKILDKHKAPPEYREYARKAFDEYIDRIKRYDPYWTSDKPPTDR
jgi:hypothetical protein